MSNVKRIQCIFRALEDRKYILSLPRPRVNIEFIGQLFRILSSRDFQMLGSSASILLYYVLTGNFAPIISLNDCLY